MLTIFTNPFVKEHCQWRCTCSWWICKRSWILGGRTVRTMVGKPAFACTLRRKDKARTVGETSAVWVAPDRAVDSGFILKCFLAVCGNRSAVIVRGYELRAQSIPSCSLWFQNRFLVSRKVISCHTTSEHCVLGFSVFFVIKESVFCVYYYLIVPSSI